jgi:outer membrane lipoprotein SlyB
MGVVREKMAKITNNPIGSLLGAAVGFMAVRKFVKPETKYRTLMMIGGTIVGALVGAMTQSKIKSKKGEPTKETVEKKV